MSNGTRRKNQRPLGSGRTLRTPWITRGNSMRVGKKPIFWLSGYDFTTETRQRAHLILPVRVWGLKRWSFITPTTNGLIKRGSRAPVKPGRIHSLSSDRPILVAGKVRKMVFTRISWFDSERAVGDQPCGDNHASRLPTDSQDAGGKFSGVGGHSNDVSCRRGIIRHTINELR